MRSKITQLILLLPALMLAPAGFADEAEDVIKYRKSVMRAVGGHMSATALIVQGKASFPDDLAEHSRALATILAKVETLFPEGSDFGDTRAKDAVWSKPAEFKKVAKQSSDAAAEFLQAVKAGNKTDFPAKLDALGDSCKACHKDFRLKKE